MRSRIALGLFLVVALCCSCGGSSPRTSSAEQPSGSYPTSDSGSGSPQPQQTSRSEPPTSSTPTSAVGLVVNGNGSDLTAPDSPTVRSAGTGGSDGCDGIGFDPGFDGTCRMLTSRLGTAVAQIEARGTEERTLLWTISGSRADLALRRVRTLAQPFGSIDAQDGGAASTSLAVSDINNDGTSAFVVLTPTGAGTRPPLATLDIVQTSGLVGLHRNLHGGYARKAPGGGLETWTALDDGQFEHNVFQYQSGAWRIVADGTVARRQVPTTSVF